MEGTKQFQNKAQSVFGEVCIDKGLFLASGMLSRSIPTFVAEWILDRFCPGGILSDDALLSINKFIEEHVPRKEQKELIKNRLAEGESIKILDQFAVYVDLKRNIRRVKIPCIDENGYIEGHLIDKYRNLLGGGLWGAGTLNYHPPERGESSGEGHRQVICISESIPVHPSNQWRQGNSGSSFL